MTSLLLSFGCGIAFSFGVVFGTFVSLLATRKGRRDALDHSKAVLDKLAENVECQKRIAGSIEYFTKHKR